MNSFATHSWQKSETIEFKESLAEKESAGADLCAFANKSGGIIYFGVKNNGEVVGIQHLNDKTLRYLSQLYTNNTEPQIYPTIIPEIISGRNVIKVSVDQSTTPYHTFKKVSYIRVASSSQKMTQEEYQNRFISYKNPTYDFSSQICKNLSFADLDESALEILRNRWSIKEQREEYNSFSYIEVLEKLLLARKEGLTFAALLLCGKEEKISEFLPEAEIRFGWKNDPSKIDFDFTKDWKSPFLKSLEEIWQTIHARNSRFPFQSGFFEDDVWTFDQKSIREGILNAFAHRDYEERGSTFIEASPKIFLVKSPGKFLPGVSVENILDIQGKWRNRLLMEALGKIGLVERYGHGLDRIFRKTILDGKGKPVIEELSSGFVQLCIPAQIKDDKFILFLQNISKEKQIHFDLIKDLLFLDDIREKQSSPDTERKEKFTRLGIIEKVGKGRGTKYILSSHLYDFIGHKAEYTRKKWVAKDVQKEILWNYFQHHKKGRMIDFRDRLFEGKLNNTQILRLLSLLKDEGKIFFDGKQKSPSAFWKIKQ